MSDSTAREILRELVDATEASRDPSVVGSTCRLIRAEGAAHEYLAAPVAQPSDSKLCPRELTAQMAIAAMRTLPVPSSKTAELTVREIWQAAYDAAPAAPAISDSKLSEDEENLLMALGAVHGHEWALEHFREPRYKAAYEAGQLAILNAAPAAPGDALSLTKNEQGMLKDALFRSATRVDGAALTTLRELVACRDLTNARPPQEHEWDREQAAWAAARAVLNDYDAEGKAGDLMGRYPKPLESGAQRATDASGAQQAASLAQAGDSPVGEEAAGTNPDCQHRQRKSTRALPNSSASPFHDAGVAKEVDAAPSTNHDAGGVEGHAGTDSRRTSCQPPPVTDEAGVEPGAASPLSAATSPAPANAGHVDGPSQEGSTIDDLVARLHTYERDSTGDPLSQELYDDLQAAADALIELRRERDEEKAHSEGLEGAVAYWRDASRATERAERAEARASALHDALRKVAIVPFINPFRCASCGARWGYDDKTEYHVGECLAKPVEP